MVTPDLNTWDADLAACRTEPRGLYVAVSGNTAGGKSSLIAAVAGRLRGRGLRAVEISERSFHHQYLRLMFSDPQTFAFPIQLTFLLERHLALLRNLISLRRTVVMERTHFDDAMFVEEHERGGSITREQRQAYDHLVRILHARIPAPDVLVLMNPAPELSLRRLSEAEARGDRPREFPSEEAKEGWVRRWHAMYADLHARYRASAAADSFWANTTLLEVDPVLDPASCADAVEKAVLGLLDRAT